MTAETPEQCPVCGHEFHHREQYDESQVTLDSPAYSRKCVQRYGTRLNVYFHEKIPIELTEARP